MTIISAKDVPIGFFAMTMTFFGLASAWKQSGLSIFISNAFACFAIVVFAVVSVSYLIKFLKHRDNVMLEFKHPITMSFFGMISISTVFLGVTIAPQLPNLARLIWIVGTIMHSMLFLYILGQWLFHKTMSIEHITPACFIPVVGLVIVPVYGAAHGFVALSWLFWSVGLMLWMVLFIFVFYRLMFVSSLPTLLLPNMFILLAPPSVIYVDYTMLTGGGTDVFSNAIYSFAMFIAILLLSQIKQFKLPFSMSFWSFNFPIVAFSMATMHMGKTIENTALLCAGYTILCFVTILTGFIFFLTVKNVILKKDV